VPEAGTRGARYHPLAAASPFGGCEQSGFDRDLGAGDSNRGESRAMNDRPIYVERDGAVAWVRMNRPERLNAFSGTFSIPQNMDAVNAYSIDDDRFVLSMTCGDHLCKYWIDPEYRYVTKYQVQDAQGRIILEALTSSVTEQDSVSAPRRIRVKFPEEGRQISIYYSSLTLNATNPSFEFSIPTNAQTIVR